MRITGREVYAEQADAQASRQETSVSIGAK